MKKYVSTMVAGVAVLAIAGSASAQTITLRLTGSTAFRSGTHNSIIAMMTSNLVYGYSGSTLSGAGQSQFKGYVGAIPVNIKCSWAGSAGGVQTVVQNRTDGSNTKYLAADGSLTVGGQSGLSSGPYDAPVTADVTMSDSYQGQTLFTSPALVDTIVGVVPFTWVRNSGSPSTVDNMTVLQSQLLLGAGQIPVGLWSGSTNDTDVVTIIGRDEDSGTRIVNLAESGFGVFGAPLMYQVAINGTFGAAGSVTNSVTGIQPYPINTILGVTYPAGHSGYSSGGTLAGIMATPGALAGAGTHIISYMGISDAIAATNNGSGAAWMKWNGVDYTPDNVRSGKYTYWSYEHLMYRNSLSGTTKTIADTLANTIKVGNIAPTGINLSTMGVSRSVEGGVVSP